VRLLLLLLLVASLGCATYEKLEEDLSYVRTEYNCIGVSVSDEQAICFDTVRVFVRIVW